jgi:hypothetical protein
MKEMPQKGLQGVLIPPGGLFIFGLEKSGCCLDKPPIQARVTDGWSLAVELSQSIEDQAYF